MSRGLWWIAALAPQVAVVAGMVFVEEHGRATGTEVRLEVRAYDPMDPLSGRYIRMPLAIERMNLTELPHAREIDSTYRGTVYVRLREGERWWEPAEVLVSLPESGGPFLLGRLESWYSEENVHLHFDVDRFYIPEAASDPTLWTGNDTRRELALVARVTSSGSVHVVDLLVDGRPYTE